MKHKILALLLISAFICQPSQESQEIPQEIYNAAYLGHTEQVAHFLQTFQGDIDQPSRCNSKTILCLACAQGHTPLVELLINRGANIEQADKNDFNSKPIETALFHNHLPVIDLLLEHNATVSYNFTERAVQKKLDSILEKVRQKNSYRGVYQMGPESCLEFLWLTYCLDRRDIVKKLLETWNPNIDLRKFDNCHGNPLCRACYYNDTEMAMLFLDKGMSANVIYNTQPLILAGNNDNLQLVQYLLQKGAKVPENIEHYWFSDRIKKTLLEHKENA